MCSTKIDLRAQFFKTSSDGMRCRLAADDAGMGGDHMPFLLARSPQLAAGRAGVC